MEKEIKIRAKLIKKHHILRAPDLYKEEPLLCLWVNPAYLNGLIAFSKITNMHNLEVVIREYINDPTERAIKFFFVLRDRVAEASGDTSKEYKSHLHHACVREFHFVDDDRNIKSSIKELNKKELWSVTEAMHRYALEANAYIGDLRAEYREIEEDIR